MAVRDASELIYPAVQETIASLGLLGNDAAVIKVAQQLAKVIDSQSGHCRGCTDGECRRSQGSAWAMRWLAPELLKVLVELGATPTARAQLAKGAKEKPGEPVKSQLTLLREGRGRA